jgi:nucleoside-diphosphate-sugar epimerase
MGEELARVFHRCFAPEVVGLRYFNVFGPRQDPAGPYAAVIPRFFAAYLRGQAPLIHGDGEQSRDFTYVADAVAANLLAAGAPAEAAGRAFNVAAGAATTVNELARSVARVLGGDQPEPRHGPDRPGDVRHSLADLGAATAHLGYRPSHSLAEGLVATAASYRTHP